jgi:formiminoglutamase
MDDIELYLSPRPAEWGVSKSSSHWNSNIHIFEQGKPLPSSVKIALVCIESNQSAEEHSLGIIGSKSIRNLLGKLEWREHFSTILDAGNIIEGETQEDTEFALKTVLDYFLSRGIIPFIIAGNHLLSYAHYLGYENQEQLVNVSTIDYKINLGSHKEALNDKNYLSHIVAHQPNYLFNFSHIGHQVYFNKEETLQSMDRMFFETLRLGALKKDVKSAEPLLRNADMITFDLEALECHAFPGNSTPMPNGISAAEACQLMWYAGMSDKLSSIGLYGFKDDQEAIGAQLLAEMIWYFVDGYSQRKGDFPQTHVKHYKKFVVQLSENEHELVFYKSPKSDRWWVEVPYPDGGDARYYRHLVVPCTYEDYQMASGGEMPNIWWQTYQKLV